MGALCVWRAGGSWRCQHILGGQVRVTAVSVCRKGAEHSRALLRAWHWMGACLQAKKMASHTGRALWMGLVVWSPEWAAGVANPWYVPAQIGWSCWCIGVCMTHRRPSYRRVYVCESQRPLCWWWSSDCV
jgi:hypothetical protein